MIGDTYLERGEPVRVLVAWLGPPRMREKIILPAKPRFAPTLSLTFATVPRAKSGPRNVLIERADGTLVVRPFRGLRRPTRNELRRASGKGDSSK